MRARDPAAHRHGRGQPRHRRAATASRRATLARRALRDDGYAVTLVPINPPFPARPRLGAARARARAPCSTRRSTCRASGASRSATSCTCSPPRTGRSCWPGAGDAGGAAARQARGAELSQRRGRRPPARAGAARPPVPPHGRRDRRSVATICGTSSRAHGYSARVDPERGGHRRFRYRERVPLRPRLLSTRNLEPHYDVDDTIAAFALLRAR